MGQAKARSSPPSTAPNQPTATWPMQRHRWIAITGIFSELLYKSFQYQQLLHTSLHHSSPKHIKFNWHNAKHLSHSPSEWKDPSFVIVRYLLHHQSLYRYSSIPLCFQALGKATTWLPQWKPWEEQQQQGRRKREPRETPNLRLLLPPAWGKAIPHFPLLRQDARAQGKHSEMDTFCWTPSEHAKMI